MKQANRLCARAAVLLGEDEVSRGVATVRDMESHEQETIPLDEVVQRFRGK